jgi:hypothetical protein
MWLPKLVIMKFVVFLAVGVIGSALAVSGAEIVSNCDREEQLKAHPVRVSPDVGKKYLVNKGDIAVSSVALKKLQDSRLSLDLAATDRGGIDCFTLYSDKAVEFSDQDKEELRGAIATALQDWQFQPYFLNGKAVRLLARFTLKVDRRKLVIAK